MDEECLWQWWLTVPTAMTCALVEATLDHIMITRPTPTEEETSSSLESTKQPRRWVVERLRSGLNRSRRLLVRWEKLDSTYKAFVYLACGLICFQHCDRFRSLQVSE